MVATSFITIAVWRAFKPFNKKSAQKRILHGQTVHSVCGTTVLGSNAPLSQVADTTRLLTRVTRPRLLEAFRRSPPGPILSNAVAAGIPPPPTLFKSYVRFLPFNGL